MRMAGDTAERMVSLTKTEHAAISTGRTICSVPLGLERGSKPDCDSLIDSASNREVECKP